MKSFHLVPRGEVVYADSAGEAASHREPVAIFAGEVLPQYAGDLDDGIVGQLLDELAGEMGRTLEQEEVHIAYGDRTWTLKADECFARCWPRFERPLNIAAEIKHGKAASSGIARLAIRQFGRERRRLRSNFVAEPRAETKDHGQ